MDAGINNVIYMELHSGPKMANSTCGKTIVAGTIDRGSTVFEVLHGVQTCQNSASQSCNCAKNYCNSWSAMHT
jgi:hypothetical protein